MVTGSATITMRVARGRESHQRTTRMDRLRTAADE